MASAFPSDRFSSVLVANRGEIALRVFRTATALGLRTIAVYTDLDEAAPHARAADQAVRVPNYLDIDAIVMAAINTGADIVHPGYGFLSERGAFAAALENKGIVLAGPSAAVMELMGRKDTAREVAIAAGVPVVPSYSLGDDPSEFAYPVLVKAAAGGGGKGMRVVRGAAEFPESLAAARREAISAFGDDTLLIEKYVESGRHLEVQVMGARQGTVLHLWERDCSTQRRHQKVLEEAPAPTIDASTRERLTESAVALAREAGYVGAGTVEYLLDSTTGEFYFLEMNTRLQVEHPVTEAITGLDLVELQLRVAAGETLSLTQADVQRRGHAIEARVYAEDAFAGFLPQAGTATHVRWPKGASVRVDHALESGQTVSTSYDPMLGKVIAYGRDREAARRALVAALDDTAILGLTTNTGFLRVLAASEEFRTAAIDTAWLDHHRVSTPDPAEARLAAAWQWFLQHRSEDGPYLSDGFRLGAPPVAPVIELDEPVILDQPYPAAATTVVDGEQVEVVYRGHRFLFTTPDRGTNEGGGGGDGSVVAPMPGTMVDVRVTVGQAVAGGDVLGTLEAMKMEVGLRAPFTGTVVAVEALPGGQVSLGARLFDVARLGEGRAGESIAS